MEQGSPEWIAARVGKLTGSRIADAVRRTQKGRAATSIDYMTELIMERLTGQPAEHFVTKDMQWGTDHEDDARDAYAFRRGAKIERVGFIDHPNIDMSGSSPDGLIGNTGMIEIKCPKSTTHMATLLGADIDADYVKQIQWGMACTGHRWCDWISYDPRFPDHLQLVVRRIPRLDDMIADLEADARDFISEVDAKTILLEAKAHEAAA